jgi:hypothetical protein
MAQTQPLMFGAWSFFGDWSLEFGASTPDYSIENSEEPFAAEKRDDGQKQAKNSLYDVPIRD